MEVNQQMKLFLNKHLANRVTVIGSTLMRAILLEPCDAAEEGYPNIVALAAAGTLALQQQVR